MAGGYIQADILGRTRGLKFGALAAENITSDLMTLGVATGGNYTSTMIATIVYWGLFNNAIAKRQELDVSFEEILDWTDENYANPEVGKILEDICRCYEDSNAAKTVLETLEKTAAELKKKMARIRESSTSKRRRAGSASEDTPSAG
jgi:hypothetical protein